AVVPLPGVVGLRRLPIGSRVQARVFALPPHMSIESMRSVAAVVALAACLHAGLWANFQTTGNAPNVNKSLASVSYAPFEGISHPDDINSRPTEAQIRADLKAIAPYT